MRRLALTVAEGIRRRGLWSPGDRVAVAVSGGMDSVVLLDLLARGQGVHGGELSVVTIDHGTRPASAADAASVVRLARELGLPCEVARAALGSDASEAACRELRYTVFDGLAVDRVALGHHRDDQVETSLLGWMRGGGTRAHAGMAWRRGRYVRPLLDQPREALARWAGGRALRWHDDPSNEDARFLRNRVRHELIPMMESLRPGCTNAMARGASHAASDELLLQELSQQAEPAALEAGWPSRWVTDTPGPLVRRALQRALGDVGSGSLDAIVAAARVGRGRVELGTLGTIVVEDSRVRWVTVG